MSMSKKHGWLTLTSFLTFTITLRIQQTVESMYVIRFQHKQIETVYSVGCG